MTNRPSAPGAWATEDPGEPEAMSEPAPAADPAANDFDLRAKTAMERGVPFLRANANGAGLLGPVGSEGKTTTGATTGTTTPRTRLPWRSTRSHEAPLRDVRHRSRRARRLPVFDRPDDGDVPASLIASQETPACCDAAVISTSERRELRREVAQLRRLFRHPQSS